uniref:Hsp90 co-chaperone Cdc37 n=1 Tax=Astyanax mexicanus TaxID=7994 RepID=A0A8B9JBH0_ASTMX
MTTIDYSVWDHIEVSDDEDDTHPNIDTPSLFRWRHQVTTHLILYTGSTLYTCYIEEIWLLSVFCSTVILDLAVFYITHKRDQLFAASFSKSLKIYLSICCDHLCSICYISLHLILS